MVHYEQPTIDHSDQLGYKELERLAYYDTLTGLLNRRGFSEQLKRMAVALEGAASHAVVLVLDVNDMKGLNDGVSQSTQAGGRTSSHERGDAALVAVADALDEFVGEGIAARLGGDEFAAIVPVDLGQASERATSNPGALILAHATASFSEMPFQFDDDTHPVRTSVGGRLIPWDAELHDNAFEAAREADHEMYLAKEAGKAAMELCRLETLGDAAVL